MPEDLKDALTLQEQIARIGRELADAEHKRVQTLDVPRGATARSLVAGAALFGAGATFATALGGAVVAILRATGSH
jgi:hypothetical protein